MSQEEVAMKLQDFATFGTTHWMSHLIGKLLLEMLPVVLGLMKLKERRGILYCARHILISSLHD